MATQRTTLAILTTLGLAAAVITATPAQAHSGYEHSDGHGSSRLTTVVKGLDGPRGVASLSPGVTLVSETDGSFSLVKERRNRPAKVIKLGSVPGGFAPAIDNAPDGVVYALTGAGEPGTGASTLYRWSERSGEAVPIADIAAYQATDPDPADLENFPEDSNPFGLAVLKDGSVLVADAAGNDLLRVYRNGHIKTVATLKPRTVKVPEGLPAKDPEGNPIPPAGTRVPAEAVATSVTVGADGYWYVGELRGFPATPGTSQIWRIKPGSTDAVCDPGRPYSGRCTRYADGLTSIVDLGADRKGNIYAVTLSKKSWLQVELGTPGAEVGGLFKVSAQGHGHRGVKITELARDRLVQPGGVDVASNGTPYVVGPVFGPGTLSKID
jgi:hypothetical protein